MCLVRCQVDFSFVSHNSLIPDLSILTPLPTFVGDGVSKCECEGVLFVFEILEQKQKMEQKSSFTSEVPDRSFQSCVSQGGFPSVLCA